MESDQSRAGRRAHGRNPEVPVRGPATCPSPIRRRVLSGFCPEVGTLSPSSWRWNYEALVTAALVAAGGMLERWVPSHVPRAAQPQHVPRVSQSAKSSSPLTELWAGTRESSQALLVAGVQEAGGREGLLR